MSNKERHSPPTGAPLTDLDAIIPNLHWRYTGVTATNRMIAPQLARLAAVRWFGPDAPDGVTTMPLSDLLAALKQLNVPVTDQISILEMLHKTGKLQARIVKD